MDRATREPLKPARRRRRLRIAVLAAIVLLAGGGVFYLRSDTGESESSAAAVEEEAKAPIPVEVAELSTGAISTYLTSTANLVAENEVKVLAEAEGRVARLLVDEGDAVSAGQILATLVRDDAEIVLRKARLEESSSRRAFERARDLVAQELISREEYDNAAIRSEITQQELAEAEWRLGKTTIRAPFAGRISRRFIQAGQNVRSGIELFTVTDLDPLIARVYLPEKDLLGLDASRPVAITLNAAPEVRFAGRIRQISPVVDTETGTVKLTVEVSGPPPEVRPGSFVTVEIVRDTHEAAVLVPRKAVLRELNTAHVFVARDDVAEKVDVELGLEDSEWIEALSGLAPGEKVVVAGQGGLKSGARIQLSSADDVTSG